MTDFENLMTVKEVAALLKVDSSTIYKAVTSGSLQHLRIGNRIRITREAVEDYVQPKPRAHTFRDTPATASTTAPSPAGRRGPLIRL